MINVGIAGSFPAINRHKNALSHFKEVRVAGTWSASGAEQITDIDTGVHVADPDLISDKIDVLIITDSGNIYNQLATLALRKARHVFLYPAVLNSIDEVFPLVKLAREANVILKCGKTGKESIQGLLNHISDPKAIGIIEYQHVLRINPSEAATSLPEIMLGDMERILKLIKARNISIKAKGLCMISDKADVINARMEFDNGSAVNYYCNTVGTHNEHTITLFLKDSFLKFNLHKYELSGWHVARISGSEENPVFMESLKLDTNDYLVDELHSFFSLIQSGPAFLSIYDNGFESFVLTDRILEKVMKTLVQYA